MNTCCTLRCAVDEALYSLRAIVENTASVDLAMANFIDACTVNDNPQKAHKEPISSEKLIHRLVPLPNIYKKSCPLLHE